MALADSDWYFGTSDPRAPHDAWLEDVRVSELRSDDEELPPETRILVRLLNAHHNGIIEFMYSRVMSYALQMPDLSRGHCDWRYDEFRLSDDGNLIHEIEWCGATKTGRWLIQSRDVSLAWHSFEQDQPEQNAAG